VNACPRDGATLVACPPPQAEALGCAHCQGLWLPYRLVIRAVGSVAQARGLPPGEATVLRCPIDGQALRLARHHGVEVDFCMQCSGVWLDRGEQERIVATFQRTWHAHQPQAMTVGELPDAAKDLMVGAAGDVGIRAALYFLLTFLDAR
jgi:Zn-finger nucleic acid-binding protein